MVQNYTVKISEVEEELLSEKALLDFFERIGESRPISAKFVRDTHRLDELLRKRRSAVWKLEEAYFSSESGSRLVLLGSERASMDTLSEKEKLKVDELASQLLAVESQVEETKASGEWPVSRTAFVVFKCLREANNIARAFLGRKNRRMSTSMAEDPRAIYWNNLTARWWHKLLRSTFVDVLVFIMICLWMVKKFHLATFFANHFSLFCYQSNLFRPFHSTKFYH